MSGLKVIHPLNRRQFLAGCAGCAAAVRLPAAVTGIGMAELMPSDKPKVRLVFTHPDPERQGWPYQHYDYEGRKKKYLKLFAEKCPDVEFLPVTVKTDEQAEALLKEGSVDGYLVYILGIPSNGNRVIANSGQPTIVVDDLYGGTGQFLGVYPQALAKGMPVAGVSSSDFNDVAEAANTFVAIKRFQSSVLLDVTERELDERIALYKNALGANIRQITAEEFNAAYENADRREGAEWAKRWIADANTVVEPSEDELKRSGAMYAGMRDLLRKHRAQGIAVDCLRLFYGNKMTAYPCMGFFQLNNDGLVGACEADLESATTMLLMTYMTGRPGYISDPVIDTSKNQIIYAHCVAPSKVYGPDGPENPYDIRDHSEDRKGAAVQSLMPLGEMTTSLKLIPWEKKVVFHQAKAVENIHEDRACRTKLAAEPPDARQLLKDWKYGWHRVTVYGDWKVRVETAAALLGFQVEEEG